MFLQKRRKRAGTIKSPIFFEDSTLATENGERMRKKTTISVHTRLRIFVHDNADLASKLGRHSLQLHLAKQISLDTMKLVCCL